MALKGSRTEKNLLTAFAGESQARNRYSYFASQAKKDGFEQISAVFSETADQEKEFAQVVEAVIPTWEHPISLDRLLTSLAAAKEEHKSVEELKNDPPKILFANAPAISVC